MNDSIARRRQPIGPPAGHEGYLSRQEAAARLGLPSEYKVRQFEREGRLHAVRGRMGAAFYPEAEVLALRARLGRMGAGPGAGARWSDAELLALLRQPTATGRVRTAVDLVTEAQVSIARAERVYRFWAARDETIAARVTRAARLLPAEALDALGSARLPARAPVPPAAAPEPAAPTPALPTASQAPAPPLPAPAPAERRSPTRLAHEVVLRELRSPDPRVRAAAFARLRGGLRP